MSLPDDPFDFEIPEEPEFEEVDDGIVYTKVFKEWDVARPNMSTNAGNNSPAEQGRNTPAGWKPTIQEPVPPIRCVAIAKATGEQCKRWSLRGAKVCPKHGGRLPNVKEHAEAVVESARMRLMGLADEAVDGLEDLIKSGTAPQVRLGAIKEVLDRAGLKGGPDVSVEVTHNVSYKDEIFSRLKDIKERKAALEKSKAEMLEGEIIGESQEGE